VRELIDVVGIGLGSLLLVVMFQVMMLGKRFSYRARQSKSRPSLPIYKVPLKLVSKKPSGTENASHSAAQRG
jgi:hypothetical protein